ncbi:MAG TPA: dihydropteroate synthase [Acidobacteriaceae bacterium]
MGFATRTPFDWQLRTRSLALGERTLVMAAVNLTPDSFSGDGLAHAAHDEAVKIALQRIDGGADILDLGAESTRPGALPVSADAEQVRLLPVLEAVLHERPSAIVSVDTYHASTARAAASVGAEIINDVSGLLWDDDMGHTVAKLHTGLILMHTRGRPTEWRTQPAIPAADVVALVLDGLDERLAAARAAGILQNRIVLDPGFGFGKRGAENFALLAGFERFSELGRPLLAGLSLKGFLGAVVAPLNAVARLNATMAANVAAILAGAHIVRVHDLQEAREAVAVADAITASALPSPSL